MKRIAGLSIKIVAVFAILSFFTSGCTLIEDILRALGRLCATPVFEVTTTADIASGLCTTTGCSLRQAVLTSNACPGTQSIHIPAGTYTLTHVGAGEDAARTGDLDLIDSVNISGSGNPVIDGNNTDRVFDILSGATVDLTGLVIQDGHVEGVGAAGGGIRNKGTLHIHNSTIASNSATYDDVVGPAPDGAGGGIYSTGNLAIDGSQILVNRARIGGGVLIGDFTAPVSISFDITDTTIEMNGVYDLGGGLFINPQVNASLTRFNILRDTSSDSECGGIANWGNLSLDHGTIQASGMCNMGLVLDANALLFQDNDGAFDNNGAGARAVFRNSAFVDNRPYSNPTPVLSAIRNRGDLDLYNSTVSGNQSGTVGAVISNEGNLWVSFSTIAHNQGVGIESSGSGRLTADNSIFADNSDANCRGSYVSNGFNIDSGVRCGFSLPSDLSGDPLLQPLTMVGDTFVHTFDTASPSPALDSADSSVCPPNPPTDQLGTARPQNLHCDRGAWEAPTASVSAPLVAASPTPAPTETPTAIPAAGLSFIQPNLSVDHFYSGGAGCGPLDLKLQVGVSQPNQVSSVVLFFHLKDKAGSGSTDWNEGVAMGPLGSGQYSYDLASKTIPAFNSYPEAWFVYQFTATGAGGQVVLRSPAYSNVTLTMCGKK
jgi:CSLREA domain-containing protein